MMKKMNTFNQSFEAAEEIENIYKKYRQQVALETMQKMHKEFAKEKLKLILYDLEKKCENYNGTMGTEFKNLLAACFQAINLS